MERKEWLKGRRKGEERRKGGNVREEEGYIGRILSDLVRGSARIDGWMNGWIDECNDGWRDGEIEEGWIDARKKTLHIYKKKWG